jgi:hypothetical protein
MTDNASLDEIGGIASLFMRDTVAAIASGADGNDDRDDVSASCPIKRSLEGKRLSRAKKKLIAAKPEPSRRGRDARGDMVNSI